MYCIHPEGAWPLIGLYDKDVFEEIIRGEFPEGPEYETDTFGGVSWEPGDEDEGLYELFKNNKNNGAANLIHYAYDLCVCTQSEETELLNLGIGHYSDEIEVPILDNEAWWLENPDE